MVIRAYQNSWFNIARSTTVSAILLAMLFACATNDLADLSQSTATLNNKIIKQGLAVAWDYLEKNQVELAIDQVTTLAQQKNLHPLISSELIILQIELLLRSHQIDAAVNKLNQVLALLLPDRPNSILPKDLKQKLLHARAAIYNITNQQVKLLGTWIKALSWLPASDKENTIERIWPALQNIPPNELKALAENSTDYSSTGWYTLAYKSHDALSATKQHQVYTKWREDWSNHIAAKQPPMAIQILPQLIRQQPRNVAVMLPLSGPLASAGQAIQNGIIAAHFDSISAQTPGFSFFDTGAENTHIGAIYKKAVDTGAELIIGPLQKTFLADLLKVINNKIPVLALNYLPTDGSVNSVPPTLYQFGLYPADELSQLAKRAWLESGNRALIIYSDTPWGRNNVELVKVDWQKLGGKIIQHIAIKQPQDAVNQIADVLNIVQSDERKQAVEKLVHQSVEFGGRRRQDIDVILLIANQRIARAVKPALDYNFAGDIPVYATSRSIPGNNSPEAAIDLRGIRYCDLPWRVHPYPLRKSLENVNSEASGLSYGLFALGIDAARLASRLPQFKQNNSLTLNGTTGQLSLSAGRRFYRRLAWAEIKHNTSTPIWSLLATDSHQLANEQPSEQ